MTILCCRQKSAVDNIDIHLGLFGLTLNSIVLSEES